MKQFFYIIISISIIIIILIYIRFKEYTFINILTRTGNRKQCFNNLMLTLNKQSNKNFKHIKSNDNKKCTFLNNYNHVIDVNKIDKSKNIKYHCPYNLYLNQLIDSVKTGWIIIIDDDCKFIDNKFLENLSYKLFFQNKNEILVYNIFIGSNKHLIPGYKNMTLEQLKKIKIATDDMKEHEKWQITFDMACMVFHSSNKTRFKEFCAGDIRFFETAINKGYIPKFLNIPIGIWANYEGGKLGNNKDCSKL